MRDETTVISKRGKQYFFSESLGQISPGQEDRNYQMYVLQPHISAMNSLLLPEYIAYCDANAGSHLPSQEVIKAC